jgi:hypothetical protein
MSCCASCRSQSLRIYTRIYMFVCVCVCVCVCMYIYIYYTYMYVHILYIYSRSERESVCVYVTYTHTLYIRRVEAAEPECSRMYLYDMYVLLMCC